MTCDTDMGGWVGGWGGSIVRVIYWMSMFCYMVGAERKTESASKRENWGTVTNRTSSSWTGGRSGGQEGNWDKHSQP